MTRAGQRVVGVNGVLLAQAVKIQAVVVVDQLEVGGIHGNQLKSVFFKPEPELLISLLQLVTQKKYFGDVDVDSVAVETKKLT